MMNIEQLQELKLKLTQEKDLAKIWLFYMDHFVDYPEFTDLGKPSPNSYLEAVLKRTCQQLFGKTVKISDFLSIFIAEYQFFHGAFQVEGRMGGVIFFEDIRFGLMAVSKDLLPNDTVLYSRFSEPTLRSTPNGYELN
jgi:hypothetical protein